MTIARRGALALLALGLAVPAFAQDAFPNKPVRVISPFPAGNVLDPLVRGTGDYVQKATGQPVVIEHKPGGAGVIAAQALLAAPADGYTVLLASSGLAVINPHTFSKLPYDPEKDFAPITQGVRSELYFVVSENVPARTLKEFLDHAKANLGKTNFGSFTPGNPSHFAGVLLNKYAGIDMTHVGYRGTPPVVQDLLGGNLMSAFLPLGAVRQHLPGGKVRLLASAGAERRAVAKDVPTFKEAGFPQIEIYTWAGFVARSGTPQPAIDRLNALFVAALNLPELAARLAAVDLEPKPGTPAEFAAAMKADSARWAEAVKLSGFKAD